MGDDAAGNAASAISATTAVQKRREEKAKKKDPKSWENILKLACLQPETERTAFLGEKYKDLYDENRRTALNLQAMERHFKTILREKDQLQTEHGKCILHRSKLENLCRELQKNNKKLKDVSLLRMKEEDERRRVMTQQFNERFNNLSSLMDETNKKSDSMREENLAMQTKFNQLNEHFKQRDNHIAKLNQEKELQKQLANATIAKLELEKEVESLSFVKERELLESKLEKSNEFCKSYQEKVEDLEQHIAIYQNQYTDFESTMAKSNEVFTNFKTDMAKMTKRNTGLEKELHEWKSRYHTTSMSLIRMTEIQQKQDNDLKVASRKLDAMQSLCRELQNERGLYLKTLKDQNIEIPKLDEPTPPSNLPAPQGKSRKPSTGKEVQLANLKQQLKEFQHSLLLTQLDQEQEAVASQIAKLSFEAPLEPKPPSDDSGKSMSPQPEEKPQIKKKRNKGKRSAKKMEQGGEPDDQTTKKTDLVEIPEALPTENNTEEKPQEETAIENIDIVELSEAIPVEAATTTDNNGVEIEVLNTDLDTGEFEIIAKADLGAGGDVNPLVVDCNGKSEEVDQNIENSK